MDDKAIESSLGAVMLDFHKHLLYPTNSSRICYACSKSEERARGYICKECVLYVHKDCVEINNLYRHKHPLKLLEFKDLVNDDRRCFFCEQLLHFPFYYHCFICGLTLCATCPSKPLVVDAPMKIHNHSLTQMMINDVSFTCDACGLSGHGFPCVCLQCCFIIHEGCVKLPRVIHINRHDHRVSHTYLLGLGDWTCGVCLKEVNRLYGVYSCSTCRYAVHSKCATRNDVWNGVELEDVPEDENQDLDPFETISDGLIKHFSHEHNLRLVRATENNDRCYACNLLIYCDPYYTCKQCHFILHETCSNFLRLKRHELAVDHFTLYPNPKSGDCLAYGGNFFKCDACDRLNTGFRFRDAYVCLDIRCATISGKFLHGSHPHSLFIPPNYTYRICSVCDDKRVIGMLSCVECIDFFLCFKCATIPNETFHKYDTHIIYLRYCGDLYGNNYYCEICEKITNPKKWFYSCEKCDSVFHIDCLLGITPYLKPGHVLLLFHYRFEVVSNNYLSRPFCRECSLRCEDAFILKSKDETDMSFICSLNCLSLLVEHTQ